MSRYFKYMMLDRCTYLFSFFLCLVSTCIAGENGKSTIAESRYSVTIVAKGCDDF